MTDIGEDQFNVGNTMTLDNATQTLFQRSLAVNCQPRVGGLEYGSGLFNLEVAHIFHLRGDSDRHNFKKA